VYRFYRLGDIRDRYYIYICILHVVICVLNSIHYVCLRISFKPNAELQMYYHVSHTSYVECAETNVNPCIYINIVGEH